MSSTDVCPSEDDLFALASDQPGLGGVRDHVGSCSQCQGRVEELSSQMNSVRFLSRGSSWGSPSAPARSRPVFIGKYFVSGLVREDEQLSIHRGLHGVLKVEVQLTRFKQAAASASRELIADACRKLAAVQHPAVARVLDVEFSEGSPCLVHERAAGTPLPQWLGQRGINSAESQRVLLQVAEAVEDMHRHGLAHGALGGDDILVDDNGQPRIVGFGTRRILELVAPAAGTSELETLQREDVRALAALVSAAGTPGTAAEIAATLRRRMSPGRRIALWLGGTALALAAIVFLLWVAGALD